MPITVRPAQATDLDEVARLFDLYRQFYELPPDRMLAQRYISDRLARGDSLIFVASAGSGPSIGFTQLYPTLCSLAAAPIFVLYDLFVAPPSRCQGVARSLMSAAQAAAAQAGAVRLELATARTNVRAQALYESLGWVRDDEFHRYSLALHA